MTDEMFKPDTVDAMLRRAMKSRDEHAAPIDLARRAIERADTLAALAAVTRVNRLNRLFTAIAAIVIITVAGWVFRARLSAGGFQPWSDTSTTTVSDDTSSATDSATTTAASQWMFIGLALSVTAIGVIAVQRTIGGADEWVLRWNASTTRARAA